MKQENDYLPPFSLSDFKKWMDTNQEDEPFKKPLVGMKVESKVNLKKLLLKIEPEEGDLNELAKAFKTNGGIIIEADGNTLMIEVNAGTFMLHKAYVEKS